MLELKNIKKTYTVGDIETRALDGINVAFRKKEFVAILGASGSGKTTCLNIIGGLDRYDSGEMSIKGKKTSDFKDADWDAYRNNSVGFVFQSYNLIMHQSIVANVELGMTLSGVSQQEKHRRALEVLERVGLSDHLHKKPNQLSGGQMQRVAIARALANDPEILLCDEPTGALDTATSAQIMDLIKELSQDRLVIMVTHNPDIANEYCDRIIRFEDGKIVSDSHPHEEAPKPDGFSLKKTSMSFLTALRLSFNNIMTKKGRTFLTSFASSIGIIGIAVILSLSTGFQTQIDSFQRDALAEFPVIISQNAMEMNIEKMENMAKEREEKSFKATDRVYLYDPAETTIAHTNIITEDYLDYVKKVDPEICRSIGYTSLVSMNVLCMKDNAVTPVSFGKTGSTQTASMSSMQNAGLSSYPENLDKNDPTYLEKNYDLLEGSYPKSETDLVMVIDTQNRINFNILKNIGFVTDDVESVLLSDIVGKSFKIAPNDVYYQKSQAGFYQIASDLDAAYKNEKNIEVVISGIVRLKEDAKFGILSTGIAYSDALSQRVCEMSVDSEIVKAQTQSATNVLSPAPDLLEENTKQMILMSLGATKIPFMIMLYPESFENKDQILTYLDKYNDGKENKDKIIYTDLAGSMSELTGGIMDGITIVLIAFAGISLVVSLIMICIITYTSVLERTKEIGILRALGARKKDITRVFDAETCILGVFSGVLGVVIAWLLTIPINMILLDLTELEGVASLKIEHALLLVLISTLLTVLGGHIPAKMASRKDAVEALRSE